MRLYRGLKERYRPERAVPTPEQPLVTTGFTDCPLTALRYANARRGVVLVLDVPPEMSDTLKFTEELWLGMGNAKRFMAWGKFDTFITAVLPAKELRALIRLKGVASAGDEYKAALLKRTIHERLDDATREARRGSASGSPVSRAACLPVRR
jgi:hypothetical protein